MNTAVAVELDPAKDFKSIATYCRDIPEFSAITARQRRYLIAYAASGGIFESARIAGISWPTHYSWMRKSEDYKKAFEIAEQIYGDYGEGNIRARAFVGEPVEVFRNGELIRKYNQKSDVLAMFAMKKLKKEYCDNFSINQFAGPVQLNVKLDTQAVDPLQLSGNQALLNQGNTDPKP